LRIGRSTRKFSEKKEVLRRVAPSSHFCYIEIKHSAGESGNIEVRKVSEAAAQVLEEAEGGDSRDFASRTSRAPGSRMLLDAGCGYRCASREGVGTTAGRGIQPDRLE
jgi:hypothetical protein